MPCAGGKNKGVIAREGRKSVEISLPHATFKGKDAQLAAAVKYLQELVRNSWSRSPSTRRIPIRRNDPVIAVYRCLDFRRPTKYPSPG
jgi:hypothetical protein